MVAFLPSEGVIDPILPLEHEIRFLQIRMFRAGSFAFGNATLDSY
jgi:hypothetical protein